MWGKIYDFFDMLWGYPMLILLVGGGLYYGIRTGFFQIRGLPLVFRKTFGEMFGKKKQNLDDLEGSMSPFQALSTVLAGTVGSGNMAGIIRLRAEGKLPADASVVAIVTGNGLKDTANGIKAAGEPIRLPPDMELLREALNNK